MDENIFGQLKTELFRETIEISINTLAPSTFKILCCSSFFIKFLKIEVPQASD